MPDRVELLAPAGSMEALRAAVSAGADAVYLGTSFFGARADVGFSEEDTKKAIDFAHLYGCRIHVTVNTLCKEQELDRVRDTLRMLEAMGADAVLVQDLGVLKILREEFPSLTVHASTQMTIHQKSGVAWLKKIGVKRAVLARECSLEDIASAREAGLETEVFAHGALCVSVSGQCGLSSWIGPRSGNRGRCAQPCRLSYEYRGQKACWLSPADLCARDQLPLLLAAGVSSLKIEGRLKRPEYVFTVTRLYREALDQILSGTFRPHDEKAMEELTQIFSRGSFTAGYPAGKEDRGIIYPEFAAAKGLNIGETLSCRKGKDAYLAEVALSRPLNDQDGLRLDQQTVRYSGPSVPSGTAVLRLREAAAPHTEVWRTESEAQLNRAREGYTDKALRARRPLPVRAELFARPGVPARLRFSCGEVSVLAVGAAAEQAQARALNEETALRFISRLGDTPFTLESLSLDSDGAFLSAGELNRLRRQAAEMLENAVRESHRPKQEDTAVCFPDAPVFAFDQPRLYVSVPDPSWAGACLSAGADRVIVRLSDWRKDALCLLPARWDPRLILQLPAVAPDSDLLMVREWAASSGVTISLGTVGQLGLGFERTLYAGPSVPVMNGQAERMLCSQGVQGVTLSREMSIGDIRSLPAPCCERLLQVYGLQRLMLLSHCPERTYRGLSQGKKSCALCAGGQGTRSQLLTDQKGSRYPLLPERFSDGCRVNMMSPVPVQLEPYWKELRGLKLSPLLVFTTEAPRDSVLLTRRWRTILDGKTPAGSPPPGSPDRLETGVL